MYLQKLIFHISNFNYKPVLWYKTDTEKSKFLIKYSSYECVSKFLLQLFSLIPLSSLNRQECNEWKVRGEKISFRRLFPRSYFHMINTYVPSSFSSSKIVKYCNFNKMDFLSYHECFSYLIRILERVFILFQTTKI